MLEPGDCPWKIRMTDERAARLLASLPEGEFILKLKFLRNSWRWLGPRRQVWPSPCEEKEGTGHRWGLSGHKISNRQCVLSESLPCHRTCLRSLPCQDSRSCQSGSFERWWPELTGPESCGEFWGRFEKPWTYTHTAMEKTGVRDSDATVDDVARLEKIPERSIILRDIAGKDIFNSEKHQHCRYKTVELICHNGHAWPKDLHFPQSREVHIYKGNVWQAIREAICGEPLAVWLLGGQDRQLTVDQFVLRPVQWLHERFKEICAELGNPEPAETASSENHVASIMTKEENPSQPPPRHPEGFCGAWSWRTLDLDGL